MNRERTPSGTNDHRQPQVTRALTDMWRLCGRGVMRDRGLPLRAGLAVQRAFGAL
jgi:hypothetical protein